MIKDRVKKDARLVKREIALRLNLKKRKKLEFLSNNLFSSRRKKLKNKIESLYDAETIEKNNLKNYFDLRAENLDRDTFFSLVKLLK